jgi:hypothetical protein
MVVDTRSPKAERSLIPAALGRSAEIDTTAVRLLIDLTAFKLKPTAAAVVAAAAAASRQHTTTSNCCWLTDCRLAFAARARNLFALILAKR